ncbi:MAG: ankyrin repeat domain-containing protein [Candidatus Atribacteria bacterium]|nr:ankyrin repeat domain-containing protein [Candidatus Atribacteria bacterium]
MKQFHRMFLVIGAIIIFFWFVFPVLAVEFSADLKIKQPDRSYEFKYYTQGDLYRLEKITGEDRILVIADRKLDITWMLNPEGKIYMELKGTDAAFFNPIRGWEAVKEGTKEEQIGTETIQGYLCEKYTYTPPGGTEPGMEGWYSSELETFIRMIVHYGGGYEDGIFELLNIKEAPQDGSLFKVPEDYQKEKSPVEKAQEKEAAWPVLTGTEEGIAPTGRRLKTGAALKVKVEPDKSVRVVIENQIKEKSNYKITPFREGLPIEEEIIHSGLTRQREKNEQLFGMQLKMDQVLIEVEEGLVTALVTKEYSSFDEVERKEYFVMEKSSRGLCARENRKFILTLTGDSQGAEISSVKVKFYKGEYSDLLNEESFNLPNGQIKKWEFNPGEIQTFEVSVGEAGGVKLLSEQYPAKIKETVKELSDDEKKTLIKDLITQKKLDGLKALLDSGVDVNMIISSADSLLMTACSYSNSDMVKLLLTYNPNINYQDEHGNNALNLAIDNMEHYKEMLPLLLEAGADPNSKAGAGRTAQKNSTVLSKMTSLTLNNKSEEEEYQIVEMFLSYGADPNIAHKTAGSIPLMAAAYKGDVRLVKLFLEYGVDPNLKDKQGRTALDMAKKKQQQGVIDLLQ